MSGVFDRFYRDHRDLVLLTIDPARLDAEVRDELVGSETFPHIYGPISPRAVIDVRPLDRQGRPQSLAGVFIAEMAKRMAVAIAVMALIVVAVMAIQRWT